MSLIRHDQIFQPIREEHTDYGYPIKSLCMLGHVSRSAYYKWLHRDIPANEITNERIDDVIEKIDILPSRQTRETKNLVLTGRGIFMSKGICARANIPHLEFNPLQRQTTHSTFNPTVTEGDLFRHLKSK